MRLHGSERTRWRIHSKLSVVVRDRIQLTSADATDTYMAPQEQPAGLALRCGSRPPGTS
jgi:hypothetical protein